MAGRRPECHRDKPGDARTASRRQARGHTQGAGSPPRPSQGAAPDSQLLEPGAVREEASAATRFVTFSQQL